jgi:hypothetical protein
MQIAYLCERSIAGFNVPAFQIFVHFPEQIYIAICARCYFDAPRNG